MNMLGLGKYDANNDQSGAALVLIAVLLIMFLGFVALAIDVGHLYVVRNELQNAADAGALAGAQVLYSNDGQTINTGANAIAGETAKANVSDKIAVEVNYAGENGPDVQRGHWQFSADSGKGVFSPNSSTIPAQLWDYTTEQLNNNTNFINAVRVVAHREATPAISFFAHILGFTGFNVSAEAVAYIGFAGTLEPFSVDQPISLCEDSLRDPITNAYTCNVGRMINNGNVINSSQTGGFTNFEQDETPQTCDTSEICNAASVPTITPLIYGSGNPLPIRLGGPMSTTNGLTSNFPRFECRWMNAPSNCNSKKTPPPTQLWNLTLPVVDCNSCSSGIQPCSIVVGAVSVNIVWITHSGVKNDPDGNAPYVMGDWANSSPNGVERWDSFVSHFKLKLPSGQPATYANNGFMDDTIYMQPDCTPHIPTGRTGGQNFGILAKTPVLVN